MLERREIATFTKLELLLKVTGEVVMPRELNRWTKRCVGLDENLTGRFAAASPARHLREQLKCAFAGAKIRQMEREIGIDNPDQRHVWKMQTFGNHLRADEDVDLAGAKIPQRFAISVLARHRIGVHSRDVRLWEKLRDRPFHFLGPEAGV